MNPRPTESTQRMAVAFAALANPVRIDIVRHVARHRHCCCKDVTGVVALAQSTVSQHIKVLVEAGLLHVEAQPPRSRYRVNEELLASLRLQTSAFVDECCACGDTEGHAEGHAS